MIVRVDIENLVIVERAEFLPGPGLTAVTGETGAGKTLLATAIGLLFGGDADAGQVGPGADQAWVEGEFDADDAFWSHPSVATLAGLRPEPDAPLVLARRVERSGRSRALAWGRTIAKSDLAAAGALLVATAGQHVQVRLRSAEFQRGALDGAGDATHATRIAAMLSAYGALTTARSEHARIEQLANEGSARADILRDGLARIEALAPTIADEFELRAARDRVRHHAVLVSSLAAAGSALDGGEAPGAIDFAGRAYAAIDSAVSHDPELGELAGELRAAQEALSEAASGIASRLGDLAEGPGAIDEIEDRLAGYDELHRHFGGTTEAVLATWEQLREQVMAIDDSGAALTRTSAAVRATEAAAATVAERLTASRCALADQLAADVHDSLIELGMSGSVFRVGVADAALSATGADKIEFLLAPADGIEPRPVAQVASGGELSRIALALLIATGADGVGTILFDEIDAGIGGHTAHAVASLLRRLADGRQVICITHLPQVAARADAHVVIEKHETSAGVRTELTARAGEDAVLDELTRMLGADVDDVAAREHARQLRGPRFDITAGGVREGIDVGA